MENKKEVEAYNALHSLYDSKSIGVLYFLSGGDNGSFENSGPYNEKLVRVVQEMRMQQRLEAMMIRSYLENPNSEKLYQWIISHTTYQPQKRGDTEVEIVINNQGNIKKTSQKNEERITHVLYWFAIVLLIFAGTLILTDLEKEQRIAIYGVIFDQEKDSTNTPTPIPTPIPTMLLKTTYPHVPTFTPIPTNTPTPSPQRPRNTLSPQHTTIPTATEHTPYAKSTSTSLPKDRQPNGTATIPKTRP